MSLSTCGSLKICCNFQWVLVVVRDVEKESGIESEGLQKKANFFRKRVFAATKIAKIACVARVARVACVTCVACVACVMVSVVCTCFFQSSVFWVEFAVDRFVAIRGKLRVSEVCSNKPKFSPL